MKYTHLCNRAAGLALTNARDTQTIAQQLFHYKHFRSISIDTFHHNTVKSV